MRKRHPALVAIFEDHGVGEFPRVDHEQDQIGPASEPFIGRDQHLFRCGQVDEAFALERRVFVELGGFVPAVCGRDVQEWCIGCHDRMVPQIRRSAARIRKCARLFGRWSDKSWRFVRKRRYF